MAQAAQRTHLSVREETFCLLGLAQRDSTYVILAVVRPDQKTEIRRVGNLLISSVYSRACPFGTIADLHTHPFSGRTPSWIDAKGWIANRRYTLHLIAFVQGPNQIGFTAYDYSDVNRPRGLSEGWLVTQH